jgi:hypothetical protein
VKKQKTKSYKEIREVWYKKLETSGFKDIETNDYNLKTNSNVFAKKRSIKSQDSKYEYFYMARQFLNDYKFNSRKEQIIWEYWSEGMSVTGIVETLRKTKIVPKNFDNNKAFSIITKLKEIMLDMYLMK